jgi:hypothetical protein
MKSSDSITGAATPTLFQRSAEVAILLKRFEELDPGETITYEEINMLIPGIDCQRTERWIMESARKAALRDDSIVLACVREVGLKRIVRGEIVEAAQDQFSRIRQQAKKGLTQLDCAEYDTLNEVERLSYGQRRAAFGVLQLFSKPLEISKLKLSSTTARDTAKGTLGLFMNGSNSK